MVNDSWKQNSLGEGCGTCLGGKHFAMVIFLRAFGCHDDGSSGRLDNVQFTKMVILLCDLMLDDLLSTSSIFRWEMTYSQPVVCLDGR